VVVSSVLSFFVLEASAFRDWRSNRSRTGVEGVLLRVPRALVADTGERVEFPLREAGIPLFSARLLAMDDWGSLRREGARVGDVVDRVGDEVLAEALPSKGAAVAGSVG